MPAEIKRVQPGVYMIFLAGMVTEEEVAAQFDRYRAAAQQDEATAPILVFDTVSLANPLKAARLLPPHIDPATAHIVTVNSNRAGAVLTERLAQKLPDKTVESRPNQPDALTHARTLNGRPDEDWPSCDYL